ncbi:MAG: Ig-like domain-containing protein, partial [Euryarchaeota archaeon]
NGVKYTDTTKTTNANGQISLTQSFGSAGQRTYYATFAGDSSYAAKTSSVVTINVGSGSPTQVTLSPSTTTPTVNQQVTFTANLKSGTTSLANKPVTIYHYLNGVKYTDTTKTTNANGQITLTQTFSSTGPRTYYATFAGDTSYAASTSSVVTLNVR